MHSDTRSSATTTDNELPMPTWYCQSRRDCSHCANSPKWCFVRSTTVREECFFHGPLIGCLRELQVCGEPVLDAWLPSVLSQLDLGFVPVSRCFKRRVRARTSLHMEEGIARCASSELSARAKNLYTTICRCCTVPAGSWRVLQRRAEPRTFEISNKIHMLSPSLLSPAKPRASNRRRLPNGGRSSCQPAQTAGQIRLA